LRLVIAALLAACLPGISPADEAARTEPARFQVEPWTGVSTVRLGGLDAYPVTAVNWLLKTWSKNYGEHVVSKNRQGVDWAAMNGVDLWYHVDQLVRVGMKIGYHRTGEGYMKTETAGADFSHVDEWNWSSEFLVLGAAAGFKVPVPDGSLFVFNLSLGTAWATVNISHRNAWFGKTGPIGFTAGDARGTGTGFFPEFSVDYERDLFPGLILGGRLGYCFGAVQEFRQAYDNSVNSASENSSDVESTKGHTVRMADGTPLLVDYAGIFLNISVSSRF